MNPTERLPGEASTTSPMATTPLTGSKIVLEGDMALRHWWLRRRLPDCRRFALGTTIDPATRGELLDASHGGLFGDPIPLVIEWESGNRIDAALLEQLVKAPATVILNSNRPPTKTEGFERLRFDPPGASTRSWQRLALELGVTLNATEADLLRRSCRDDTARGLAALELCDLGRLDRPTVGQLRALLVSSNDPAAPWEIGDRIEAGRLDALELCDQTEPLALHAYLSRRWMRALQLAEGEAPSDGRDQRLVALHQRLGVEPLRRALLQLAASDQLLKQYPADGLAVLVTRLCHMFRRN
jgi:hypothetical protein